MVIGNILETTEMGKKTGRGKSGIKKEMKKLMVFTRMIFHGEDSLKIIFIVVVKLQKSMLNIITMDKKSLRGHL